MSATIEPASQALLDRTHDHVHAACVVCGATNRFGLRFTVGPDGSVTAAASCGSALRGYDGVVQGGVVAALLDSAMANALFARGIVAVTARLNVRYHHPLATDLPTRVRGWLGTPAAALYRMGADLLQGGRVVATADGVFVPARPPARPVSG